MIELERIKQNDVMNPDQIQQAFNDIENVLENLPGTGTYNAPYTILECTNDGSENITEALAQTLAKAVITGKYTVLIPTGTYWIRPGIKIPQNIKLIAIGNVRFITKETELYNVLIELSSNVQLKDIIFDQSFDSAMFPTGEKGSHIIHAVSCDNYILDGLTFYGYGRTSVLLQPNGVYGKNITVKNCIAYWQRKVNTYYDSTIFNIDGLSGEIYNNKAISIKGDITDWKAESGFEIHSPDMNVFNNTAKDCINGILHVQHPMQQIAYDYKHQTRIYNNNVLKCVRGIVSWGSHLKPDLITRNLSIFGNYINLHLESGSQFNYYYPETGISLMDGKPDDSIFTNISIHDNQIETTYENGLNVPAILDYAPNYKNTGAIRLTTNNSCEDIEICRNIIDYPFGGINLIALRDRTPNMHRHIRVLDNRLRCAYYHVQGDLGKGFSAAYNLENVDDIEIRRNRVYNTPIRTIQEGINVNNVKYEV